MFTVKTAVDLAPLLGTFVAGYASHKYVGSKLGDLWAVLKGDLKSVQADVVPKAVAIKAIVVPTAQTPAA